MPERGFGPRQPGSWGYSLLPYIEQRPLWELGRNSNIAEANARLVQPMPLFSCPTRRHAEIIPISDKYPYLKTLKPFGSPPGLAHSDYAINSGATLIVANPGPATLAAEYSHDWPQPEGTSADPATQFTGISYFRTGTPLDRIIDGASQTYLVGEKYMHSEHYLTGESNADNDSLFTGFCSDNHRHTRLDLTLAADDSLPASSLLAQSRFGSAHAAGANMVYCDGSVQAVSYDVDPLIHYRAGHCWDQGADPPQ